MDGQADRHGVHGCDGIEIHFLEVNRAIQPFVNQVGKAHAQRVSATFGRQAPGVNQLYLGGLVRGESHSPADDFGVHARAADVFAELVHDEHLDLREGKPRDERLRKH